MTQQKRLLALAAQLADGIEITDDIPELDEFRTVARISAAFLSSQHVKTSKQVEQALFQWGHLKVLEKLGEGGFGEVYRAHDGVLDREVALKLHRRDQSTGADSRAFIQEARRLARVRHPNVLAVHGADVHRGRVGLWMDLLDGQDLKDYYQAHACMDANTAFTLLQDMAAALTAVHDAGLIHGDIKASNVMIHGDDQFILMDFGASSERIETKGQVRAGTPVTMAPELFADAEPTPASDQYALGVMLYWLLSGRYPLTAKSIDEMRQAHVDSSMPSLATSCPKLPRGLIKLVDSLLLADPSARPLAVDVGVRVRWLLDAPERRRKTVAVSAFVLVLIVATLISSMGYLSATRSKIKAVTAQQEAVKSQRDTALVNDFLNRILFSANTAARGPAVTVLDILDQAANEASALAKTPTIHATILHTLGKTYNSLQQLDKAERAVAESLEIRIRVLGETHIDTLKTMVTQSIVYQKLGNYPASRSLQEEVLLRLQAHHDPSHSLVARSKRVLAKTLFELDEFDQADALLKEAKTAILSVKPVDQGQLGLLYLTEGNLYQRQSRYAEAERVYVQALSEFLKVNGENGNSIRARLSLANSLFHQGKLSAAENQYRENIQVTQRMLGTDHSAALGNLVGLGAAIMEQGRFAEALSVAEEALALSLQVQGDNHKQAGNIRNNIANIMNAMGDVQGAEAMMRDVIKNTHTHLGRNHEIAFMVEYNLAELLNNTGRYWEAEKMARDTYARKLSVLGKTHHFSLESLDNIGVSLWGQGKLQAAKATLEEVLEGKTARLSDRSPHTLNTLAHLARTLADLGDFDRAVEAYQQLVMLRSEVLGDDHPQTLEAIAALDALVGEPRH